MSDLKDEAIHWIEKLRPLVDFARISWYQSTLLRYSMERDPQQRRKLLSSLITQAQQHYHQEMRHRGWS